MFGPSRRVARRTSRRVSRRQQAMAPPEPEYAPPPEPAYAPPPAEPAQPAYVAELEQLGRLKEQGLITDDEYEAKKKQILGI
jgi:hypothetical protein